MCQASTNLDRIQARQSTYHHPRSPKTPVVMQTNEFEKFEAVYNESGTSKAIDELCSWLREEKRFHELFEALKIQVRHELGLPLLSTDSGEGLDEKTRHQLEDRLIEACREIGTSLIESGQIREGWGYLRPVGNAAEFKDLIARTEATEDNLDQIVEICLHESLDVHRGMKLVLENYGICNAITTFESAMYGRPREDRQIGAELLVEHLYDELLQNVRSHVERQEEATPTQTDLAGMIKGRDYLTADGSYHVDTTHLSSTVRAAREISNKATLQKALEMTFYGEMLDDQLQYPSEEPFAEMYLSHRHYFNALLGQDVDGSVAYFKSKAENCNAHEETTMAIEIYVELLHRVGRSEEAIDVLINMIPEGMQTTGVAPNLIDLCKEIDNFEPLKKVCRNRNDLLGFAMGVLGGS